MKIADADSIKAGEQELINSIMEQLNSEMIESMASGKLTVQNLEFRHGDMVIHGGRIVYKMEFQTSVSVSVMFDRDGNLINDDENTATELEAPDIDMAIAETDEPVEMSQDDMDALFDSSPAEMTDSIDMSDSDDAGEDDINNILEKNRDFWMAQTSDATEPVDTSDLQPGDDDFKNVLEKNRNFWVEQAENSTAGE